MESSLKKAPRNKLPALLLALLALVVLIFIIWRVDSKPATDDAYVSADTIDVVPEVSGRIVELAVVDNQQVKQGDLLVRIKRDYYEAQVEQDRAQVASAKAAMILRAQDTSPAAGENISLQAAIWPGWISVLPSMPSVRPCSHSARKPASSRKSL